MEGRACGLVGFAPRYEAGSYDALDSGSSLNLIYGDTSDFIRLFFVGTFFDTLGSGYNSVKK